MRSCERCGSTFGCEAKSDKACWCLDMPKLRKVPSQYKNCLCPRCLQSFALSTNNSDTGALVEGEDFYYQKNLFVFTEKYHLKRGHCCKSACKHCPYGMK